MTHRWLQTARDLAWGTDRHIRIRLRQWAVSVVIYFVSALAMAAGVAAGWWPARPWEGWCAFVFAGLAIFYGLLRSGCSRRFADQALTQWQITFGVATVLWGYLMGGPLRSTTLFPLMMILTFGAFSLDWRRMAGLTLAALGALAATMVVGHRLVPSSDARVDIANLVAACIMLPAASMVASILGGLRVRLRTQKADLGAALARIEALASQDPLTGLHNRRRMNDVLAQEAARAAAGARPPALALLDLDHFKLVNDRHGHAVGDEVLRHFSRVAGECLRQADSLARWGGEEFLLLLPDTGLADAAQAIERLRARLGETPVEAADGPLVVAFSAGLVECLPGEAIDSAVGRADAALYRAKQVGRGRTEVALAARATVGEASTAALG